MDYAQRQRGQGRADEITAAILAVDRHAAREADCEPSLFDADSLDGPVRPDNAGGHDPQAAVEPGFEFSNIGLDLGQVGLDRNNIALEFGLDFGEVGFGGRIGAVLI